MCRNCGALVGPDETSCSMCGAPKVLSAVAPLQEPAPYAPVHDRETIRFARAVLSRPYIFTIVFLVANVFVFLLMWSSSGLNSVTMWQPPFHVLYAYGAKLNFSIDAGQWWRFVTPVFIHIGLAHLLVNMYGLWMIGPYVERLYGSAKFVVLWVGTGVAGVVASYLSVRPAMAVGPVGRFFFSAGDGPSAGASGALFGLIGLLFVFGIKFRRELPEGLQARLRHGPAAGHRAQPLHRLSGTRLHRQRRAHRRPARRGAVRVGHRLQAAGRARGRRRLLAHFANRGARCSSPSAS